MNCYMNINLLPDPEFQETILMSALFAKLHRRLASLSSTQVGISFPKYTFDESKSVSTLGSCLRLHGLEGNLSDVMQEDWLKGLHDYTQLSSIQPVPVNTEQYRVVKRVQVKSNVERLLRRSIAKGRLTQEMALQKITTIRPRKSSLPFIQMKSCSTGQQFRLFIQQSDLQTTPTGGCFNSYGLSIKGTTVPWF
jgi:CRISPR-associated endonuclease Csy4